MNVTFICTIEPCSGKAMMIPACELYRSILMARRNVERREYASGIATWIKTMRVHPDNLHRIGSISGDIY